MLPLPLIGERVTLRRFRTGDLARFQAYRHDPQVGLYQGWTPQPDDEATAFIAEMAGVELFVPEQWFQLAIADNDDDELIGDLGVCVREGGEEAEIGFTLRTESQGCGLASEAVSLCLGLIFQQTQVARVVAVVDARNAAALRLLERFTAHPPQVVEAVFRGEACVEHVFSIDRESFAPR